VPVILLGLALCGFPVALSAQQSAGGAELPEDEMGVEEGEFDFPDEDLLFDDEDLFGDEEVDLSEGEAGLDEAEPERPEGEVALDDSGGELPLDDEQIQPLEVKPPSGIEEIIITSQGRSQPLQEAAISVAAFDEEYLSALGAQNIMDVAKFTPNLEIRSPYAATSPTLFIRGVGLRDFNANSSSSVAVYNDDVYMNSPVGMLSQLFDVQNIEILRGPQGALYGRNASAGAIRIVPRRPVGEYSAYTRATYGKFDQREVEGAVEMPIVADVLSARISGVMNRRGGIMENRCADPAFAGPADISTPQPTRFIHEQCFNTQLPPGFPRNTDDPSVGGKGWIVGVPAPVDEKVNDVDNWAGRALLRWQPNEDWDWVFNVHGGRNRGDSNSFQTTAMRRTPNDADLERRNADAYSYTDTDGITITQLPGGATGFGVSGLPEEGDPFAGDWNEIGTTAVDLFGVAASGDIYMGSFKIRSVTGYEWNQNDSLIDFDSGPQIRLEADIFNQTWQFYQDLRLLYDAGTTVTWQVGATALYEELEVDNEFPLGIPTIFTKQEYEQKTFAYSFFAYGGWELSEELSIEGGIRWNFDSRDMELQSGPIDKFGLFPINPGPPTPASVDFVEDAPSGDITVSYKPYEDVSFYAKYSRGWKGPHINGLVVSSVGATTTDGTDLLEPVKPEVVNAVELGVKSMWWDQRLRLNLAGFHYDYDDIQVFQVRNIEGGVPLPTLVNAEDAELFGAELEIELRPLAGYAPEEIDDLTIFMSAAILEGQYNDFDNVRPSPGTPGKILVENFSGNQLINAPRGAFAGYAQWGFKIDQLGTLTPRLDWTWKDKVFFSPSNFEELSQEGFWLLNLRLGYRTPNDLIEMAVWVRNLTDEVYRADAVDLSRFQQSVLYSMGDPRTYGVDLTVRF
jgi:iron complex outermembrane receptor protein